MRFFIVIGLYFLFFAAIKLYIAWGLRQVFVNNRYWALAYLVFSVLVLVLGLLSLSTAFGKNNYSISLWSNLSIALMASVFICEVILASFFLIDDVIRVGTWLFGKFSSSSTSTAALSGSRRRLLKTIGLSFTAVPFAAFLYGITKGKYAFKVFEQTLVFPDLPAAFDGFRVVQFSDVHSGSFDSLEAVRKGLESIQALQPDLILFTGDLVNDYEQEIVPYKALFKDLKAPFGKYSILGNHDYPFHQSRFDNRAAGQQNLAAIKQHHADMDFNLMLNENAVIEKQGEKIKLLGCENWSASPYFGKVGDLDKALEGCQDNDFCILMTHDPSHWDQKVIHHPKHIALTLAGHTHGCQMGLELPYLRWSPAQYVFKHWAGLYQEKDQYLYVNRGFGFLGFAGRVGIPPEITLLTLRKGQA